MTGHDIQRERRCEGPSAQLLLQQLVRRHPVASVGRAVHIERRTARTTATGLPVSLAIIHTRRRRRHHSLASSAAQSTGDKGIVHEHISIRQGADLAFWIWDTRRSERARVRLPHLYVHGTESGSVRVGSFFWFYEGQGHTSINGTDRLGKRGQEGYHWGSKTLRSMVLRQDRSPSGASRFWQMIA